MRKLLMTPGPTFIHEDVRRAMSKEIMNPDLEWEFYELYRDICEDLKDIVKTENDIIIMSGEGILGLEAACASLIEKGDSVLCIENGIFGRGFGDFIEMYGGETTFFSGNSRRGIDLKELEQFLNKKHDFKLATLVHCETPSGITNDIENICRLLKSYGIVTVVDAVSSIGGEDILTDEWGIDILLGASQKVISASPGITFLSISEDVKAIMNNRKEEMKGFYLNLAIWEGWYEKKWFPYTPPVSSIFGFGKAVERIKNDTNIKSRHLRIGRACRESLVKCGLELYGEDSYSNTVTTVCMPENISSEEFFKELKKEGIIIAGAFDFLKDKVFRIGHMGENCRVGRMIETLKGIDKVLRGMGVTLSGDIHVEFLKKMK